MVTDENAEWAWSITYGGDEPISHPFYRVLIEAMVGLKVEARTHGGATVVGICCGIRSNQIDINDVLVPLRDIYNIHIC